MLFAWINQICFSHMFQHFVQVLGRFPLGHRQVVEKPVAAVLRGSARHFAFKLGHEAESFLHQFDNILRFEVALHQQVVAGEAAHRSPIDNLVGPSRVVAQISGGQVLDGVQSTMSQGRFAVGFLHADVEGGYDFIAYLVFAGYVDAAEEADVVDGKAGYCFHIFIL